MEHLARFRKSGRQAVRQRAQILMAWVVYTPVTQIARICQTDEAHVRKVIHAFNQFGFESLNPKVGTGRPRTFEPAGPVTWVPPARGNGQGDYVLAR
jgi:Helix-turn-helix domain